VQHKPPDFTVIPEDRRNVEDQRDSSAVVLTAGKLLAAIATMVVLITGAMTFIYSQMVDNRFDRFELRFTAAMEQRLQGEYLSRKEFELRHTEALDEIRRLSERMKSVEDRNESHARRLDAMQAGKR